MRKDKFKLVLLWIGLLLPVTWCGAADINCFDGNSNIAINKQNVHGDPKTSSIQATINGHSLIVIFTENLGEVEVEVTTATGGTVDYVSMYTPNGYNAMIINTGSYVVTFTLENGDVYYGEFEVTD